MFEEVKKKKQKYIERELIRKEDTETEVLLTILPNHAKVKKIEKEIRKMAKGKKQNERKRKKRKEKDMNKIKRKEKEIKKDFVENGRHMNDC